ncbi:hypothetical protein QCA50_015338 [Cerrena zonata]|uniref:Peptidase A1 domain-containing protein n=1 Tax=Cerrena zonata TaxID=2478898 RepID=A0AAW0FRQ3_9APHY
MAHHVLQSLPFASRVAGRHARDIVALDKARAQKLLAGINPHGPLGSQSFAARRRHSHEGTHQGGSTGGNNQGGTTSNDGVDVTDAGVTYTASVGVGNPPTNYTLLIDTGSSNTWIGADKKYTKTSTSHSTGAKVNVSYGSGQFSGTEFTDTVTLSPGLVIAKQSIGVASTAQGFQGVDGILGIGPVDLTEGTVSDGKPVPTVTDNLFAQGSISSNSIGIFYEPTTGTDAINGELAFGSVDSSKITGDGHKILNSTAGIVDTGTTLLLIATDAFKAYEKATGAKLDRETGLLTITEQQFKNLQSLFFNIGGVTYEFTANAQIWPRSLNSTIGGEEGKIYLVTSDLGSPSGQGLDFIDGFAFLQRFYSVYDTGNAQVGLATTPFTDAETN